MPDTESDIPPKSDKAKLLQSLIQKTSGRVTLGNQIAPPSCKKESFAESLMRAARTNPSDSITSAPNSPLDSAPDTDCGKFKSLSDLYPEAEDLGGLEHPHRAWRRTTRVPLDGAPHPTGIKMPGDPAALEYLDLSLASVLNRETDFEGLTLSDLAFIDTETTGLMGGTGTYAFLIGLGYFQGSEFVIEQYFMEDFPDEPLMLSALRSRFRDFGGLVSFNGKTFDAPLLRTRFLMNRTPSPLEMPHLDLLHPARRLWKGRLASCSFHSIENNIFNLWRTSDVPGSLIPQIYIDYIRDIRRSLMVPIIDHNAQDIVSMGALFALYCQYFKEPLHPCAQHVSDQIGLSDWFRRADRHDDAIACLERALLVCRDPVQEHTLAMHIANCYRRSNRWQDAVDIWQERFKIAHGPARTAPCVELAKYYEHRAKDYDQAGEWVAKALASFNSPLQIHDYLHREIEDLISSHFSSRHKKDQEQIAFLVQRLKRIERKKS